MASKSRKYDTADRQDSAGWRSDPVLHTPTSRSHRVSCWVCTDIESSALSNFSPPPTLRCGALDLWPNARRIYASHRRRSATRLIRAVIRFQIAAWNGSNDHQYSLPNSPLGANLAD
jgi:hypothetical protein